MRDSKIVIAIRYFGAPCIPSTSGWWGIYSDFAELGVQVAEPETCEQITHLLIIDYVQADERHWPKVPVRNRFLTATEPVSVNPIQFSKKVMSKFDTVIVPSRESPGFENTVVYEGGYLNAKRYSTTFSNFGDRIGCAIINENKFSFVKESNYILRTKFIELALQRHLDLTVAGKNWTRGIVWTAVKVLHHIFIAIRAGYTRNIKLSDVVTALKFAGLNKRVESISAGYVKDSTEFLSKFKVAIVIENESSYVSEKLHAALIAGCQCVYVGPKLNKLDFPDGFLFQSEPEVHAILQQVEIAKKTAYSISRERIEEFVLSSKIFNDLGVDRRNSWIANTIFFRMHAQRN